MLLLAKKSIRTKMLVFFVTLILVSTISLAYIFYQIQKRSLTGSIETSLEHSVGESAHEMNTFLSANARIPVGLVSAIEANQSIDEAGLKELLRRTLVANPNIYGTAAIYEPFTFYPDQKSFGPYWWQDQAGINYIPNVPEDYLYWEADWYAVPRETGEQAWGEPYYDEGAGEAFMVTSGMPFYDRDEKLLGVTTVDISLKRLNTILQDISRVKEYGKNAHAILVSRKGTILGVGEQTLHDNSSMDLLTTDIHTTRNGSFKPISEMLDKNESGVVEMDDPFNENDGVFAAHSKLEDTGWTVVLFTEKDFMLKDLHRLRSTMIYFTLIILLITTGFVILISNSITRSIVKMREKIQTRYDSKLIEDKSDSTSDEIALFEKTFNAMTTNVHTTIKELEREITERKQAEEELSKHREHLEELVKERTAELEEKNKKLEKFNDLFVNREFRIKELKDKVKELEKK